MPTRGRKLEKSYRQYRLAKDPTHCDFCHFKDSLEKTIEHKYFWIIENLFSYQVWDAHGVSDHLMIVPKRHVIGVSEFTDKEKQEFVTLIADYELQHYSFYARTPSSNAKTIPHQHTHLIKINDEKKSLYFYLRKPHIMVAK